ncbi:carboxypeptidase-like regulatory domain-containing protein [Pseudacidobacterium ailaaui]|uniref:carboxypeptidase-like regulatory domain-containing protein n=1 Tax=Pseudacidobacterium ailaaui TaxID=1382359 RepID=UPI00138DF9D7|nr:carboxypeptidase-like regulatory domain-containing protein [Pseudacidobacterium ailaaui]
MKTQKRLISSISLCAVVLLLVITAANRLHAQAGVTASLSGTVVDPSGAVIPNAIVTLKNLTTNDTRQSQSNGSGDFTFSALPVGDYEIDIAAQGFQNFKEAGIHLDPGDQRSLRTLQLTPGAATQTVQVKEATEAITLDSGEASTLISAQDIQNLSVEGRDVTELLKILPGFAITNGNNNITNTTYDPSQVTVTGAYGSYSGEGTISSSVALLYNGVDVTDPGAYASMLQNINYDQVSEVKVQTSSIAADQAHGPIVINAVGISGGPRFHGSLYTYARTYQLDSTDWLSNYTNQPKPTDREVYPGFTLGGPVLIPGTGFNHSRRLTFFAGAEDYAQRNEYAYGNSSSAILSALVPTAGMRNGDFSQTQINQYLGPLVNSATYANLSQVPATGKNGAPLTNGQLGSNIDSVNQLLLNTLPLPNTATTSQGYNYIITNLVNNDLWQAQGRIDDAISDKNKLFIMYSTERGKAGVPQVEYYSPRGSMGGTNTPGGGLLSDLNTQIGSLNWTTLFSPTLTNEFYLSGAWFNNAFVAKNFSALTLNGAWKNQGLFNNGSKVIPEFQDYGYDGLPVNLYPDTTFGGIYAKKWVRTGGDNLTKVLGHHTFRLGFFAQMDTNHQVTPFVTTNGALDLYYFGETYNDPVQGTVHNTGKVGSGNGGNYLADFLEGGVFQYSQTNISPAPNVYFWDIAGYAQDHFRITPWFSIDYGVRLDHFTPWTDAHGVGIPVWMPSTYSTKQNPLLPGFLWHSVDRSVPASGLPSRWAFVEPRVGFAWDVYRNGNTVLRGGFGIYTAHDSSNDIETPASYSIGERSVQITGPILLSSVPSQGPSATAGNAFVPTQNGYGFFPDDDHQPQVYTYNLAIDQKTIFNSLLQISYIGNVSRHLLNNGSTQPTVLDDINALHVGALFGPDPITGVTYPIIGPPGTTTVSGLTTQEVNDFRPYPQYSHLYVARHNINTNYNSLQAIWNKQQGHFLYGVDYTFSKALGVLGADGNGTPADPFNYRNDYGPEAFDRTHIFNATYSYTLGDVVHKRFLAALANRWMISGITTMQSGGNIFAQNNPDFSIGGSLYVLGPNGESLTIPVSNTQLLGTPDVYLMPRQLCNPAVTRGPHQYVNGNCFALPVTTGVNGPYRMPYLHGPAFTDSDLTVQKAFHLGEGRALQFRFAAFNFLNHANTTFTSAVEPSNITLNYSNLVNGNTTTSAVPLPTALATATNTNAAVFGTAPLRTGRRISEMSLKFTF